MKKANPEYKTSDLCQVFDISLSTYYYHLNNQSSENNQRIIKKISEIAIMNQHTYGKRRIQKNQLLRLINHPQWLYQAAEITLSSKGAKTPGVDGMTKTHLQVDLTTYLDNIRSDLLSGNYQPMPARRVYIPKANGKQRPLGIPTLRDRIVQRAMLMAMEPIWENDFHSLSYGFRPERSVHHAIRTVKLQLTDNHVPKGRWVIEGDLSSYFDTVHHQLLMQCVRQRIRCSRFNQLLWRFIKAGHIERNLFCATTEGVPQGGVISPLLSYYA